MRRLLAVSLMFLLPLPVPASEFDWLVREFSRESGAKRVHVPFLGLADFVVKVGHPAGSSDMKLAIFERGDLEAPRFTSLTDSAVSKSWKPMIRVRSKDGESTNIYTRIDGKHLNLLITTLDDDDATLIQVRIEPQALMHFIDDHDAHAHVRLSFDR
jgi:hypothetical protein